jgi:translation initiation factor 3 subunit L
VPAAGAPHEAFRQQLNAFMREARGAASTLPLLKQYLLLYSSIGMAKLASLLETDEATLRQALMALKSRNHVLQWDPSAGTNMLGGHFVSVSDIDFYIDVDAATGGEVVIVKEAGGARTQVEAEAAALSRHIAKLQQITAELSETPLLPAAAAAAAAAAAVATA